MSRLAVDIQKSLTGRSGGFSIAVDFETDALTTVIFGPSGAGKTTLLRAVAGLIRADRGRIRLNETVFYDADRGVFLPPYHRHLGMVFQHSALFPHWSALDNVLYACPAPDRRRARELLDRFHVAHVAKRKPLQLSGGEQQRVAIARALAAEPRLLLLDEPLPGVDAVTRASVLADLLEYQEEHQVPYLYVTHNRVEALRLGGRAILLEKGRIAARGSAQDVFSSPVSGEAARVVGSDNVLAGSLVAHHREDGLAEVVSNGVRLLAAPTNLPVGTPVAVTIPSTEIILSADAVSRTSARNVLPGRVERVLETNGLIEVIVRTPAPFRIRITRAAKRSLGLSPGMQVFLLIKSVAIEVDPL